jgi:membrane fusion protein, heavy metal efflux system
MKLQKNITPFAPMHIALNKSSVSKLMTHRPQNRFLSLSCLVLCTAFLIACNKTTDGKQTNPPVAQAANDPMLVTVTPAMSGQFKVAPVTSVELSLSQDISGRIDTNERQLTRIGASVTGRITDILVEVGDNVRAGQALARISSPELTIAQLSFLRASANTSLAERAVDRAKQLIQADVIGSAELQRRESELSIAKAELRAASDQLALMGIPSESLAKLRDQGSLQSFANVIASQSGVVTERKVSQGQVAQPGDQLFTIADLSNVWVIGALPEQAARSVKTGQKIEINVPALGDQTIMGKVVFVSDTVSPETRSVTIRTQVDNPKRDLKPQMLATLRIASATVNTLAVPVSAVVRESDKDHVYVQTSPTTFKLTPVDLGPAASGWRPINKGLAINTPIVSEGAFHLNNERKRAELE